MDEPPPAPRAQLPFAQVYEQCADRVFRFCLLQVGNTALAEDLSEDTFLAAYRSYDRVKPEPDTVHVWLFRIARNLVKNHRRNERTRGLVHQVLGRQRADATLDVEHIAATNAEVSQLMKAMSQLKERDRRVIALRIAGGLTNRELAAVLGVPEKTASSIVHRALDRLHRIAGDLA